MADRGVEYGIRITADGKVAIAESAKVEKALDGVAQALDHVEASATQAQPAIGATMKQFAPQPAVDTAKALGNAAGKFDQVQMSAAQTAQALRQVPMQFTDIFTSLAAGQAPMQVFLQQGGQLKDMFGGAGPAARAMGGYLASLVTPFSVAAAGAGVLALAFLKGRDEGEEYRKTLALTGNVAGVTADQLAQMAARLDVVSGTQASNANILTRLAATGQVAKGQIEGVAGAISAMTEAGVSDTDALVKAFAEIGKDPVKGILKVNEAYNFLTPTVYKQIKALQDQGKQEEAVALAQETAAKAMKERADDVVAEIGDMERAWMGLKKKAAEAWDAMLGIGRKSLSQQIAEQKKLIDDIRDGVVPGNIDVAQQYLAQLDEQRTRQEAKATTGAERAADMRRTLDEEKDKKPAIRAARTPRVDKPDDARVLADWKERVALQQAEAATTEKLTATQQAYVKLQADIDSGRVKLTKTARAQIEVEAQHALQLEQQNRLTAEQARQAAEQAKWSEALAKETTRETAQLEEQLKRERDQVAAIGLTKEAVERLAVERLRNEAAAKAEYAANLELAAQYAGPMADSYRAAAEEARKQADLLGKRAENRVEGANREAAAATAKHWEKISGDIERSLTDSLYRGFESGKGFGKSFVDAIQNTLKTTVLKMVIQAYVEPVTQAARSLLGNFLESAVKSFGGSMFGSASGSSQYSLSSGTNLDSMGGGQGLSFGGGRAGGGSVAAGTFYEVNERGPELLTTGGRTFLMMGSGGGTVTPAGAGSASAAAPVQQTFRVEIHNDGTPQEVTSAVPTFDATGTVVQIFTRDLQRNGPMAQALTAFKGRR